MGEKERKREREKVRKRRRTTKAKKQRKSVKERGRGGTNQGQREAGENTKGVLTVDHAKHAGKQLHVPDGDDARVVTDHEASEGAHDVALQILPLCNA